MQNRKRLAIATLTALVLSVGVLQPASIGAAQAPAPQTIEITEAPSGPQWAYAWGMSRREALAFGLLGVATCAGLAGVGAAACGVTGVL